MKGGKFMGRDSYKRKLLSAFIWLTIFSITLISDIRLSWPYTKTDFKHLIETHPRREIREDLFNLWTAKKVELTLSSDSKSILSLNKGAVASTTVSYSNDSGFQPIIIFKNSWINNPAIPDEFKYLIILHEYTHLKQLLSNRLPIQIFMPQPNNVVLSKEWVRLLFEAEVEAGLAECDLADQLNCCDDLPTIAECRHGSYISFRKMIADTYSRNNSLLAFHRDYLFELAGHPPLTYRFYFGKK